MRVQFATFDDWPMIEALRTYYFTRWGQEVQHRDDSTVWKVATDARGVCGVYSYTDAIAYGQRWAQDFYVTPGPRGKRAAAAMWSDLQASAKSEGFAVAACVHPNNMRQLRAMHRRGFRPVAITMVLTP